MNVLQEQISRPKLELWSLNLEVGKQIPKQRMDHANYFVSYIILTSLDTYCYNRLDRLILDHFWKSNAMLQQEREKKHELFLPRKSIKYLICTKWKWGIINK